MNIPKWKDDKAAFKEKFQISYEEFVELMNKLEQEDLDRYEAIGKTSERAAILWAIDQGKTKKILPFSHEHQDPPTPTSFAESARRVLEESADD